MISVKYQNIYNQFIENYKRIHIDPFHEISEDELNKIYSELVNLMNVNDDYAFYYFKYLIDFLKKHTDKRLLCLTDYRVFSAGRYALGDLIKLGAVTIGEEISTPINCFGNSNWVLFDKYSFSVSGCYFNPFIGYSASNKKDFAEAKTDELLKPVIFKPDIYVEQSKEDFIDGEDTALNYAINVGREKRINKM